MKVKKNVGHYDFNNDHVKTWSQVKFVDWISHMQDTDKLFFFIRHRHYIVRAVNMAKKGSKYHNY